MEFLKYITLLLVLVGCSDRDNPLDVGGDNYTEGRGEVSIFTDTSPESPDTVILNNYVAIDSTTDTVRLEEPVIPDDVPEVIESNNYLSYSFMARTHYPTAAKMASNIDCDKKWFINMGMTESYEIDSIMIDSVLHIEIDSQYGNTCYVGIEDESGYLDELGGIEIGDTLVVEAFVESTMLFMMSAFDPNDVSNAHISDMTQGTGTMSEYKWVITDDIFDANNFGLTVMHYPFRIEIKSIRYIKKGS